MIPLTILKELVFSGGILLPWTRGPRRFFSMLRGQMLSCIRLENDDRNNSCYRPHHSQCWPCSSYHLSLQNKDQIFQFVKIQTQAEEQILSTQKCEIFRTLTANLMMGSKSLVVKPLRQQQQFQSSSVLEDERSSMHWNFIRNSGAFSRSGPAAQFIIVGWSGSEFQTGNSSITLQK